MAPWKHFLVYNSLPFPVLLKGESIAQPLVDVFTRENIVIAFQQHEALVLCVIHKPTKCVCAHIYTLDSSTTIMLYHFLHYYFDPPKSNHL